MKILCPQCRQAVPPDQVNMGTDLAFCPKCKDLFRISNSIDEDVVNPDILRNPPPGAWFKREMGQVIVGASTRSPVAFFLIPFMCVWSGGSVGGIYGSQLAKGEFNLTMSLFGIPFILFSLLFWTFALMSVFGKVEVTLGKPSSVFVGIGRLGWTRKFDWHAMKTVREDIALMTYPGSHQAGIVLEGTERVKFGTGLNDKRRYFMLNALKQLKAEHR
jgi:hypothetical protein